MKIFSRHRKERTFFRLGQTAVFNIVNREDVVVAARKQRSDCAHLVHRGEQLIENAVKALKRDGIALLVVILPKRSAEREKLGMENVASEHFLFILGLAQLKFKSIAMILVDVLMNNFGRNTQIPFIFRKLFYFY